MVHGSVAAVMAFVTADTSGAGQRRCPLSSRSVSHRVGRGSRASLRSSSSGRSQIPSLLRCTPWRNRPSDHRNPSDPRGDRGGVEHTESAACRSRPGWRTRGSRTRGSSPSPSPSERARKRLPAPVYGALVAGSERGQTIADNEAAFARDRVRPARGRAARPSGRWRPRVLGQDDLAAGDHLADRRAGGAPGRGGGGGAGGGRARHGDGAVELRLQVGGGGRAANRRDDVLPDVLDRRPRRRWSSGCSGPTPPAREGLIATLDWSFSMGRDWGSPEIPEKVDLKTMIRMAPQVVTQAAVALRVRRRPGIPDLTAPNLAPPGGERRRRSSAPTTSG